MIENDLGKLSSTPKVCEQFFASLTSDHFQQGPASAYMVQTRDHGQQDVKELEVDWPCDQK